MTPALNTPKSNHSMQFPIADATTALRTVAWSGALPFGSSVSAC
jgi:hypothetical protein